MLNRRPPRVGPQRSFAVERFTPTNKRKDGRAGTARVFVVERLDVETPCNAY